MKNGTDYAAFELTDSKGRHVVVTKEMDTGRYLVSIHQPATAEFPVPLRGTTIEMFLSEKNVREFADGFKQLADLKEGDAA